MDPLLLSFIVLVLPFVSGIITVLLFWFVFVRSKKNNLKSLGFLTKKYDL